MKDTQAEKLFQQALEAGRQRDYQRAVGHLQEILIRTDQMPEALLYLGRSYHALGDLSRAVQAFHFYLKQKPDSSAGHFFMGRTYFAYGLIERATAHLHRSTELEPRFTPALGLLGLALLKGGRPEEAIATFRRALQIDPQHPNLLTGYLNAMLIQGVRLFHRRRYEEALEHLRFLLQHRPDTLVVHLYLASCYRELGDHERSLHHFQQASSLAPQDPVLHLQAAATHLQGGNHQAAYVELNTAMRLLGGQPQAIQDVHGLLRLMSLVLFQNHRHREALECARRALRIDYADAEMHAIMAESFSHLGELKKARNHYLRALERDGTRREYSYGLADVLWQGGDYRELERLLMQILRRDPEDRYALYYQALALPHFGRPYEETIPALQEEIRRCGPDPHLMHALGREYLRADLPQLAEGWFQRTLKQVEDHQEARWDLVRVYRRLGQKRKLTQAYDRYLQCCPDDLGVRKEYARFLFRGRQYEGARRQLERILPEEPGSAGLRRMLAAAYEKTHKYPEAILLYRELLLETPRSEDLLRALTHCLVQTGSRATAILLLEKAQRLFKDSGWLPLELAELYVAAGQLEKAGQAFRSVLASRPQEWRAYEGLGRLYREMGNDDFAERFQRRAEEIKSRQETRPRG